MDGSRERLIEADAHDAVVTLEERIAVGTAERGLTRRAGMFNILPVEETQLWIGYQEYAGGAAERVVLERAVFHAVVGVEARDCRAVVHVARRTVHRGALVEGAVGAAVELRRQL